MVGDGASALEAAKAALPSGVPDVASIVKLPSDLDIVDFVLISPLLIPIFALLVLVANGSTFGATIEKAAAEREAADARAARAAAERRVEGLQNKIKEGEDKLTRKVSFFNKKLDSQRAEHTKNLREARERVRNELEAQKQKAVQAERQVRELKRELAAATAAKPSAPPPPAPPAPAAVRAPSPPTPAVRAAAPASARSTPVAFTVAASAAGKTVLKGGLSAGDLVVVTGAASQTGRAVVSALLQTYPEVRVRAVAGTTSELTEALGGAAVELVGDRLELVGADLYGGADAYRGVLQDAQAVVWCASSFGRQLSLLETARLKFDPTSVLDASGVREAASVFASSSALLAADADAVAPKFVLLSSAAVSRPSWDDHLKTSFSAAADIPIVNLNPENILGSKLEGEKHLRASGLPYCVVRPCGINDELRDGRLVLSTGDVATGRISRDDLTALLVSVLSEPSASGKTFEAFTVPGLAKSPIAPILAELPRDDDSYGSPPPEQEAYQVLRQLSPSV